MWDCKHRTSDDNCRKRKNVCYPGAKDCVLEGKFDFPLRDELKKHKIKVSSKPASARKRRPPNKRGT